MIVSCLKHNVAKETLSALKVYLSYTSSNTPPPPLIEVPKKGFSS